MIRLRAALVLILPLSLFAEEADFLTLQRRAESGDAVAMAALGDLYASGRSVEKDELQAAAWFRRSAEAGHGGAQARLGRQLWKGQGVPRDVEEGEYWLRRAVAQGRPDAQEALNGLLKEIPDTDSHEDSQALEARFNEAALLFAARTPLGAPALEHRPLGLKGDPDEIRWYQKAAQSGTPNALRVMGTLKLTGGHGVTKDAAGAVQMLRQAAQKGDLPSAWTLGVCSLAGQGVAKDISAGAAHFKAAADKGDVLSQRALAWLAEKNGDDKESLRLYGLAAKKGDAWSQTALGRRQEAAGKVAEAEALYRQAGAATGNGAGFAPAQTDLALVLLRRTVGKGKKTQAPKLDRESYTLLSRASEAGDPGARYHLGILYERGLMIRKDLEGAARLYDQATFGGVTEAGVRRARLLERGVGLKKNEALAMKLYKQAADAGDLLAGLALGLMKAQGRGGPVDGAGALALWAPAVEKGDALASFLSGRMHERGSKPDAAAAARFYRAAAEAGDVRAQERLGLLLAAGRVKSSDPSEAKARLSSAAEAGRSAAAVALVKMLLKDGAPDKEILKALYSAAGAGDRASQLQLARRYEEGQGIAEDAEKAVLWYRMAAVQDDPAAQTALARMCLSGQGLPLDAAQAARWLSRAATAGHAPAQRDLGMLYEQGFGVPRNDVLAQQWYKKAAAGGDAIAKKKLSPAKK